MASSNSSTATSNSVNFAKTFEKYFHENTAEMMVYVDSLPVEEIQPTLRNLCGTSEQVESLIKQYTLHRNKKVSTASAKKGKKGTTQQQISKIHQSTRIGPNKNACECQAQLHELIASCPDCGRIICSADGLPCVFCSANTNREEGSKNIRPIAVKEERKESKAQAEEMRIRLLQYANEGTERTKVHDIAGDYSESSWDSQEVRVLKSTKRKELEEQMNARRTNLITIDFENKAIVEAVVTKNFQTTLEEGKEEISQLEKKLNAMTVQGRIRNPNLKFDPPTYIPV